MSTNHAFPAAILAPHTTILHTDEPVQIVVGERSDRWHRVLNALYADGIMAGLKDREYRVLHVMMLLRQEDGHAYAPVPSIQTLTGYSSSRNIEYALSALLGHPRGLLAAAGRDRYLVLPGWSFAGRDERTSVHHATHDRSRITHDRSPMPPASREAHAPARPDQRLVETDQNQEPRPDRAGLAGQAAIDDRGEWPALSLFGQRAADDGDVRGVLADLKLREPLLTDTEALEGLTVAEVLSVAADVAADASIRVAGRRVVCLADRLFQARDLDRPRYTRGRPAPSASPFRDARLADAARVADDWLRSRRAERSDQAPSPTANPNAAG